MVYDFDTIIDRLPTSSSKWSYRKEYSGVADVIPLWVADMDFASPPAVQEAIKARAAHPIYGYTSSTEAYYNNFINWMKKRHDWSGI